MNWVFFGLLCFEFQYFADSYRWCHKVEPNLMVLLLEMNFLRLTPLWCTTHTIVRFHFVHGVFVAKEDNIRKLIEFLAITNKSLPFKTKIHKIQIQLTVYFSVNLANTELNHLYVKYIDINSIYLLK